MPAHNIPGRILWIHQNFVTSKQVGNSRAIYTVAALLEQGWKVDIVTTHNSYLENIENTKTQEVQVEKEAGLTIHRLPLPLSTSNIKRKAKYYILFCIASFKYSLELPRPDCIICSSPPLLQVIPCTLLSALYRIPLVYELRDIWPRILFETGLLKSKLLGIGLRVIESTAFRYANNCISVTPGFHKYSLSMGVDTDKAITSPTGGAPDLLSDKLCSRENWRNKHGFKNKKVIIYAGSFNEHYGIRNIVDAAIEITKIYKHVIFCFAGNGRDKNHVVLAANKYDSIFYLGALAKDELKPILAGSDFALHTPVQYPMIKMMFSGKVFDYMAAKLPVISTVDGHTGMILKLSGGGLVTDGYESNHIVKTISEILLMPTADIKNMGQSGHEWLTKNLNAYTLARQNAAFISNIYNGQIINWGIPRLMGSFLGAIIDSICNRSSRAISPLEENETLLEECLENYLDLYKQLDSSSSEALYMPSILSM